MKASELMIGDWVFVPHNGSATHYARVCGIYDSGAVSNTLEKDCGLTKASALSPIPLTAEILKKNGFEKIGTSYQYIARPGLYIRLIGISSKHLSLQIASRYIGLEYVHELQHALKLCGIEKEITL